MNSYTPTQLMSLVLQDNQWFDIFRIRNDSKNMLQSVYKMRIHHGMIVTIRHKHTREILDDKTTAKQDIHALFLKLSTLESLCEAATKIVADTEEILRNDLMSQGADSPASALYPIDYDGTSAKERNSAQTPVQVQANIEAQEEAKKQQYFPLEDLDPDLEDILDTKDDQDLRDTLACSNLNPKHPTLVNFYTNWCGWSRRLMPVWNDLQNEACNEPINFIKVDCENRKDFCRHFGIKGYPTIKLLKEGEIIDFPKGVKKTQENIAKFLQEHTSIDLS